ncbi:MAG: phytanoyl-CoA dioxygenase family protein [Acidimicrobiales bacterium]
MALTADRNTTAPGLNAAQLEEFRDKGFTVVRRAIDEAALERFAAAALRHPPNDQVVPGQTWPGPGRFTLARNAMADPDLAFIMARPEIVEPMRAALEDDPKVLMFAYYDRTPGGAGLPPHNDYKRWRPIGSSMRWAFAIVPLCDFDEEAGKLEFAPGSHRVAHRPDPYAPVLNADRPERPADEDFVDPELRRGDLAIVDMHLWHRAGPNNSSRHRTGLFTKWTGAHHPPATGWFPYNDAVRRALGPDGEHVLGFSSGLAITVTRGLIERVRRGVSEFLVLEHDGRLVLPGGPAEKEGSIPDWDEGNYAASVMNALDAELRCRPPWVSYVGDYPEGASGPERLCRVYGYRLPAHAWGIGAKDAVWLPLEELRGRAGELAFGYEADAAAEWVRPDVVRGKAVSEAAARADQYAC